MVTLSDNVLKRVKYILAESHAPGHGIRIFSSGGCCGPSLAMGIAQEAAKGDKTIEKDGIKIFLEREAQRMLSGTTLDYSETRGIFISGMPQSSCCG